jgi:hypothetical protein
VLGFVEESHCSSTLILFREEYMSVGKILVDEEDLIGIASLKCDKVIVSGEKKLGCDTRELADNKCCGSCYARRIADKYLEQGERQ